MYIKVNKLEKSQNNKQGSIARSIWRRSFGRLHRSHHCSPGLNIRSETTKINSNKEYKLTLTWCQKIPYDLIYFLSCLNTTKKLTGSAAAAAPTYAYFLPSTGNKKTINLVQCFGSGSARICIKKATRIRMDRCVSGLLLRA